MNYVSFINNFYIEAEWTKAVIATNHGAHRVLHPTVKEVAFTPGKHFHKLAHGAPCRRAHALGTLVVDANPLLALHHVAGMFDVVFIFRHQVLVDRLTYGCYTYLVNCVGSIFNNKR